MVLTFTNVWSRSWATVALFLRSWTKQAARKSCPSSDRLLGTDGDCPIPTRNIICTLLSYSGQGLCSQHKEYVLQFLVFILREKIMIVFYYCYHFAKTMIYHLTYTMYKCMT